QSTRLDLDTAIDVVDIEQHVEGATLEPFVVQPEARVLEDHELDPVASLVEEHEHVARARVHVELVAHDPREAVELPAEVDRIACDDDARRLGNAQHVASNAATRRCSSPASKPAATVIRRTWVPGSTSTVKPTGRLSVVGGSAFT